MANQAGGLFLFCFVFSLSSFFLPCSFSSFSIRKIYSNGQTTHECRKKSLRVHLVKLDSQLHRGLLKPRRLTFALLLDWRRLPCRLVLANFADAFEVGDPLVVLLSCLELQDVAPAHRRVDQLQLFGELPGRDEDPFKVQELGLRGRVVEDIPETEALVARQEDHELRRPFRLGE